MPHVAKTKRQRPVETSPHFRRSVNLERDRRDGDAPPFILTWCAQQALFRILEGIPNTSGSRAWTITGAFGTGKSSFCLYLSRVFARDRCLSQQRIDASILAKVDAALGVRGHVVPVLVTGSREPLASAILKAFSAALRETGKKSAIALADKLVRVSINQPRNVVSAIEDSIERLVEDSANATGVLLVVDELGKLLEFAALNGTQSDVYLLQQLAEIAARSNPTFVLVGVLHQDFSGYAKNLSTSEQQEWEKIRGRFEDIAFEQTVDDMVRLIAASLEQDATSSPNQEFLSLCEKSTHLGLVPNAENQKTIIQLLTSCYPLHPCVAVLLAPVFKRFGQNERSAFSFLKSAEPFGLPDFLSRARQGTTYRLVDLYHYLVGVYGDALLATKDGKKWAEAFNVEALHSNLRAVELDVLRTIALLGIVGRWYGLLPTLDTISLALAPVVSKADVESAVHALLAKSAIVHRKFNDTFNLWEGSDIDVEGRLADARSKIATDSAAFQLIRKHFSPRPLVARRHSFERGTLRYFDIMPVSPSTLDGAVAELPGNTADGHILVLIPDSPNSKGVWQQTANALTALPNVLLCVPESGREIATLARELAAVIFVEKSTPELQSDHTARRELAARNQEVRRNLESILLTIIAPRRALGQKVKWVRQGEDVVIHSQRELNDWLSRICDDIYKDSPTIQNEIINRQEISSSAAAAQGELLKAMVTCSAQKDLGIEGNPPERSIYLSILLELGLHQETDEGWRFSPVLKGMEKSIRPVVLAMKQFFDESRSEAKSLDKLFKYLSEPPFGLRNGVIPIFVCAGLLAHDADVAIYEDGAFIPELTEPVLEKLVKHPNRYAVRQWHMAGVRTMVFEQLAAMLQQGIADRVEQRDILNVVKPLMKFVRRLNEFCRNSRSFSPAAIAVRDAIGSAREPDELLFRDLPKACGVNPFSEKSAGRAPDVPKFRQALQNALAELQKGYDNLLQSLQEELGRALKSPPDVQSLRSALTKRAEAVVPVALNPDAKVFCSRMADTAVEDRIWIESIASFLANKHPAQWGDDDRARMNVRLQQMAKAFNSLESLVVARRAPTVSPSDESIHLAVVGTQFAQAQQVIHISSSDRIKVDGFAKRIKSAVNGHAGDGQQRFLLAALAGIVREILQDSPVGVTEQSEVHS